jgi:hypothetical protein
MNRQVRAFIVHRSSFVIIGKMTLDELRAAKKIAYIFSGGSARCAFQVGVIERLGTFGIKRALTIARRSRNQQLATSTNGRNYVLQYFAAPSRTAW